MPKLTIRKIKKSELLEAVRLIVRTANDLLEKNGRKPWEATISEAPAFNRHLYDTDPDGHWGAFFEGNMVGFCAAVMRGRQWYLAYLFVEPKLQLKGVGRKLLERGWDYGADKAETRALCTFPYNETALALYSSFGMMPTYPLFEMHKKIDKAAEPETIRSTGLTIEADNSHKAIGRIGKLEKDIRGYPHQADWSFFSSDPLHRIYQFYDGADWVGYSVVANNKLIAPAGAIDPKYLPDIVAESTRIMIESGTDLCRVWVGGPNAAVYKRTTNLGFRISELVAFLSTKPYSDLSRYCPAQLAIY
jgi:GNAT superfamily N-acetyltransferase